MSDDAPNPPAKQPDDAAKAVQNKTSSGLSTGRRTALKAALAAGPVLLALRGQRAWGSTWGGWDGGGGGGKVTTSVQASIDKGSSLHQTTKW